MLLTTHSHNTVDQTPYTSITQPDNKYSFVIRELRTRTRTQTPVSGLRRVFNLFT